MVKASNGNIDIKVINKYVYVFLFLVRFTHHFLLTLLSHVFFHFWPCRILWLIARLLKNEFN